MQPNRRQDAGRNLYVREPGTLPCPKRVHTFEAERHSPVRVGSTELDRWAREWVELTPAIAIAAISETYWQSWADDPSAIGDAGKPERIAGCGRRCEAPRRECWQSRRAMPDRGSGGGWADYGWERGPQRLAE